jgi:bla regulator protein blaR1
MELISRGVRITDMRFKYLSALGFCASLAFSPYGCARVRAQAPPAPADRPKFEVASVRENTSGEGKVMFGIQPGGRFTTVNFPLWDLIRQAYGLQRSQLVGGPDWMETARFDITAKAEGEIPRTALGGPPGPLQLMMQDLLRERFKLAAHRETREQPIYELKLARTDGKLGSGLRVSTTDCAAMFGRGRVGPPPRGMAAGERPPCGMRIGPGQLTAGGMPISQLILPLSQFIERLIVDRTGLTGNFDIDLTWTPDRLPQGTPPPGAPPPSIDPNGPSLFTAVQEQLGLKLESERAPVEVLVIDHVERPTPD